jgi:hypothetical protein
MTTLSSASIAKKQYAPQLFITFKKQSRGYNPDMRWSLLILVGLSAAVVASSASARPQTTAPNIFVKIHVTLTDSKIILTPKRAPRGTDAQFIVQNVGKKPHTFTFGTTKRGLGVQTGFSRLVKPGQHQLLLLYLNYRGILPYYSNTPADRKNPAMHGKFTIGQAVTGSVDG